MTDQLEEPTMSDREWVCPFCLSAHASPDFPIPCEDCPKETP